MIELCPVSRGGTQTRSERSGELLHGHRDGVFITSSDFLMDGGVTAAHVYGELAQVNGSCPLTRSPLSGRCS